MKFKIKTSKPKILYNPKCQLGEGVVWLKETGQILFVDIDKKKIFLFNIKTKKKNIVSVNKKIGFILPIKKNIFVLGLKNELRIQNLKTKKILKSIFIEKNKKSSRINDGTIDPVGNLWFGTMDDTYKKRKIGSLYCLNKKLNLKKIDNNYITPNGPIFIDKFNFYHTDSSKKIIYKIKINKSLKILNKSIFKKFLIEDGSPDGMTLDKDLNLWITHFRGAKISVLDKKGKLVHIVKMPVKNVTNCTFGGKNNSQIFVTSARKSLNISELKKYRFSGSLFSIKTNMKGLIQNKFILENAKKRSLL